MKSTNLGFSPLGTSENQVKSCNPWPMFHTTWRNSRICGLKPDVWGKWEMGNWPSFDRSKKLSLSLELYWYFFFFFFKVQNCYSIQARGHWIGWCYEPHKCWVLAQCFALGLFSPVPGHKGKCRYEVGGRPYWQCIKTAKPGQHVIVSWCVKW